MMNNWRKLWLNYLRLWVIIENHDLLDFYRIKKELICGFNITNPLKVFFLFFPFNPTI